jgi:hypothetical protein
MKLTPKNTKSKLKGKSYLPLTYLQNPQPIPIKYTARGVLLTMHQPHMGGYKKTNRYTKKTLHTTKELKRAKSPMFGDGFCVSKNCDKGLDLLTKHKKYVIVSTQYYYDTK